MFGSLSYFHLNLTFFVPLFKCAAVKYADRHNLGTPIDWPTLASQRKIPTSQEDSDGVFTALQHDLHNRARVSNFHMAFGQFLDHDLSLSNNSGGCIRPK